MKNRSRFFGMMVLVCAWASCARVDVVPETAFPLLPLAEGNRWVYADSFFTTTTLPSEDTLVLEVTYIATRQRWVDLPQETGKSGKTLKRFQGWEIRNSISEIPQILLVMGDTLYSDVINFYFNSHPDDNCPGIKGDTRHQPEYIGSNGLAGIHAVMMANPLVGDSLRYQPVLHDLPDCIPGLGPAGVGEMEYAVPFLPLVATDSLLTVTTPAGTFPCKFFGSQWWAEGVGMVQSYHEGAAAFTDNQLVGHVGTLRWKRTLISYELN